MNGQRRRGRHSLLGAVLLLACGSSTPSCEYGPLAFVKREVREDRGPLLAQDALPGTALAWSADAAELYYLSTEFATGTPVLQAVRVGNGAVRRLDPGATPSQGTPLAVASDGSAVYYRATTGLREALHGAALDLAEPATGALVLSPDGGRLLYEAAGGLRLLDLASNAVAPLGCAAPLLGFSPGGDHIACVGPATDGYSTPLVDLELASGAIEGLANYVFPGADLRWDAAGLLLASFSGFYDVGEGFRIELAWLPAGTSAAAYAPPEDTVLVGSLDFAPDGAALAAWESECLAGSSSDPCIRAEARLLLLDPKTGAAQVVATGAGPLGPATGSWDRRSVRLPPGAFAFSGDGRQIAYLYGAELHLRPTGH